MNGEKNIMKTGKTWKVLLLVSVATLGAYAGDGVIEINQAKALAGGVTPGDAEGYPITISEPGSYRLTGNLTVPDENTNGIEIDVGNVSIDLNGFSILGPTVCTGSPFVDSCSPMGSGVGISAPASSGFSIANGMISGMGDIGIRATNGHGRIENVHAENNRRSGIVLSNGIIRGCTVRQNGGIGIEGGAAIVSDNVVTRNGATGITGAAGIVTNNISSVNGGHGIFGQGGGVVSGNTCRLNDGYGLDFVDASIGYVNNSLVLNSGGTVNGGTSLGNNICDNSTTCP